MCASVCVYAVGGRTRKRTHGDGGIRQSRVSLPRRRRPCQWPLSLSAALPCSPPVFVSLRKKKKKEFADNSALDHSKSSSLIYYACVCVRICSVYVRTCMYKNISPRDRKKEGRENNNKTTFIFLLLAGAVFIEFSRSILLPHMIFFSAVALVSTALALESGFEISRK